MKTINDSYTKKERKEIAKDLREIRDPLLWAVDRDRMSTIYVLRVLSTQQSEF